MQKTIHSAEQEQLRELLVSMRKGAGLTQRQLAEKLGRERSFIARIELGERRLDLLEFRQYCQACDLSAPEEARRLMQELEKGR